MKKRQKTPDFRAIGEFCSAGAPALAVLIERFGLACQRIGVEAALDAAAGK